MADDFLGGRRVAVSSSRGWRGMLPRLFFVFIGANRRKGERDGRGKVRWCLGGDLLIKRRCYKVVSVVVYKNRERGRDLERLRE